MMNEFVPAVQAAEGRLRLCATRAPSYSVFSLLLSLLPDVDVALPTGNCGMPT